MELSRAGGRDQRGDECGSVSGLEEQVIALVAEELEVPVSKLTPSSRLLEDLGMDGDDAVEFFQAFEERFSPELEPLYRHWAKHFGPEGWGWSDYQLNWAALAALGVLGAGLVGVLPIWSSGVGGAGLLATFVLGWLSERKNRPHVPITVRDLIEAAVTKHWPLAYPGA